MCVIFTDFSLFLTTEQLNQQYIVVIIQSLRVG